jgi:hypothetical protein
MSDFYFELQDAVRETVCVNFNTSFDQVYDAIVKRFGESDMFEYIVAMAEEMYDEIVTDLYEFWDD